MSLGFTKEEDRWGNRTYWLDGDPKPLPSVTTWMSKGEPKTGIDYNKRKLGAECAIDDWRIIRQLVNAGARQQAIDYIMDAASREWQSSLDLGTTVHAVAEAIGNGWPIPDYVAMLADPLIERLAEEEEPTETPDQIRQRVTAEVEPRIEALRNFFDDWKPDILHTEVTVFNRLHDYAGTFDVVYQIVDSDGHKRTILADWKTTKAGRQGHGIYPSTACQLAAYRHGEFAISNNGSKMNVPEVDACHAVNILKGKYSVVPALCTPDVRTCPAFRKFRAAKEVAELVKDGAKLLLGDPLAPPIRKVKAAS